MGSIIHTDQMDSQSIAYTNTAEHVGGKRKLEVDGFNVLDL